MLGDGERGSTGDPKTDRLLTEEDDEFYLEDEEDSEDEGPSPAAETAVRRFPDPVAGFREGPRYLYQRAVGTLFRLLRCPCRRPQIWEDPQIFSEGTLEPHSPLAAARPDPQRNPGCLLLSGSDWKFRLFQRPTEALSAGLQKPSFDDSTWDSIPVPSQWQLLGYESPMYTNMIYPFTACPCRRPRFKSVTTGVYRRRFTLPPDFTGGNRQLRLLLQGVSSACSVWLNGQKLGYHQDSGLPAEFDASEALVGGENVLVVYVIKWCDGSYLEDQDTWWLSGIHRDVLLYALPTENAIEDYFVSCAVDPPYDEVSNAEVSVNVKLKSFESPQLLCSVLDGAEVVAKSTFTQVFPAAGALAAVFGNGSPIIACRLRLKSPAKWSPDRPKLYTLKLELSNGTQVLQAEHWPFGVRDVRVSNGKLQLNGSPLLINGVNRVEMDPDMGKAVPLKRVLSDLCLLKQHNFNAVRTAHCPNSSEFYEACDRLGLLVVDEANIETHGFAMVAHMSYLQCHPEWKGAIFERIRAMFCRDKNHTCIVGWSLGNEAGMGPNNAAGADFLRLADCSRWVQYEGGELHGDATLIMGDGRHPLSDLVCPMYRDPEGCVDLNKQEERPVVMCEYNHAMGNSNGALHHFYQVFRDEECPGVQGGFIWDFADQGLRAPKRPKPKALDDWYLGGHWGYGGDFGKDSGSLDKWFCCNGLNLPDRTPKPAMIECRYLMQPLRIAATRLPTGASVTFTHRAHGTLKGLQLCWAANDGMGRVLTQGSATGGYQIEAVLTVEFPSTEQGLWLRAWAELAQDRIWASRGHILAEETILLAAPNLTPPLAAPLPTGDVAIDKGQVLGHSYRAEIRDNKLVALWISVGSEWHRLLGNGESGASAVSHSFWRLPTDNDRAGPDLFMPSALARSLPWGLVTALGFPPSLARQWRTAGLDRLEEHIRSGSWQGNRLTVEAEFRPRKGQVLFTSTTEITFRAANIEFSITVQSNAKAKAFRAVESLPRVGLRLTLPPSLSKITWLGRGPHECYPDRKASAPWNVYSSTVEDMHFPYVVPGECGGRADVDWVALQDAEGRGLVAQYQCSEKVDAETIASGTASARPAGSSGAQFSAARFTPEEADSCLHDFELPSGEDKPVTAHIDTAHCGMGGVGGVTEAVWKYHKQYYVNPRTPEWHYSVVLTPLAPGQLQTACARAAPARGAH